MLLYKHVFKGDEYFSSFGLCDCLCVCLDWCASCCPRLNLSSSRPHPYPAHPTFVSLAMTMEKAKKTMKVQKATVATMRVRALENRLLQPIPIRLKDRLLHWIEIGLDAAAARAALAPTAVEPPPDKGGVSAPAPHFDSADVHQ